MKFITICLIAVGALLANKAIAVYVDSAYIYTTYHSADSVHLYLIAEVTVGQQPCSLYNTSVSEISDTIITTLCYSGGAVTVFCPRIDTIDLGVKMNGLIKIIAIFQNRVNGQCIASFANKDTFEFSINTGYTSIGSLDFSNKKLRISPNPVSDKLTCFIEEPSPATTLQIFSISGAPVISPVRTTQSNTHLDVSNLPAGIYFLQMQDEKQRLVTKFVKY